MAIITPLAGIRIHLSGSIHDSKKEDIYTFVKLFSARIFSEGGTVIHGSHPTFIKPLEESARAFIQAGGTSEALTFVRAKKYAITDEQLLEIEAQREFSTVQIVPADPEDDNTGLISIREWMADRADVIVCVGGKWWDVNKSQAGVPTELETMLKRGKPGFIVAGYGGATEGYLRDILGIS